MITLVRMQAPEEIDALAAVALSPEVCESHLGSKLTLSYLVHVVDEVRAGRVLCVLVLKETSEGLAPEVVLLAEKGTQAAFLHIMARRHSFPAQMWKEATELIRRGFPQVQELQAFIPESYRACQLLARRVGMSRVGRGSARVGDEVLPAVQYLWRY